MISNKTSSAVRSAINAFQRFKVLNTLAVDHFDAALQVEQQQQLSEAKSKKHPICLIRAQRYICC
jgi:hypothetical protein